MSSVAVVSAQEYRQLVLGNTDDGIQIDGCEPINLMLWIPPEDWGERVLTNSLAGEGECAVVHFGKLGEDPPTTGDEISKEISVLVSETRAKRKSNYPAALPLSVVVLACLKHRSPLPPETWRASIFRVDGKDVNNGGRPDGSTTET